MKALEAHSRLKQLAVPVFQTADAAACLGISNPHANKTLTRLAESKHVIRLSHGRWALPEMVNALTVVQFLTAPFPSYLSLQTALYHHGMISQIPSVTYAISLARTKRHTTPLGVVSIHHIHPDLFFGFEIHLKTGVQIASPEKALFDVLYLGTTKSNLFGILPELELSPKFKMGEIRRAIKRIASQRQRTLVERRLESISFG